VPPAVADAKEHSLVQGATDRWDNSRRTLDPGSCADDTVQHGAYESKIFDYINTLFFFLILVSNNAAVQHAMNVDKTDLLIDGFHSF